MREVVLDWWEYLEGRRCTRAAWYHHGQRAEGARPSFINLDERERLRHLAQQRWPLGQDTWSAGPTDASLDERTRRLMAADCPAIFRASFTAGGATIVVDILERTSRHAWTAVLLSSRSVVEPVHVETAALTLYTLRAAGVPLAAVHLLHVDAAYRRGRGPVAPDQFFVRRPLTRAAARAEARASHAVRSMLSLVDASTPPPVPTGSHCTGCAFTSRCISALPADWTGRFPHEPLHPVDDWLARGYTRMADVPDSEPLGPRRRLARRASVSGRIAVDPELPAVLRTLGPPAFYLDFECLVSLVPLFAGTAPGQHVPFLWSAHHVDADGRLTHIDAIVPPGEDPRRVFAETLIEGVGAYREPIVVYSEYESLRLRELAEMFPDLAPGLERIRERLVDLLEIVRGHVYDLQFLGDYSLKAVAPVLAPGITYRGLAIKDGYIAARAYTQLVQTITSPDEVAATLHDLRQYCARDTLALVDVHRALMHLAEGIEVSAPSAA